MKRTILVCSTVAALTLTLAGCARSAATTPTAAPVATVATVAEPTLVVPTLIPAAGGSDSLNLGVSGIGEVKANQDADLVFGVTGTVEKVLVKEGDTVKSGDLLAVLDVRGYDQQLQQALAQLESAKAGEAALTEAPRDYDAAAANAAIAQAQAQLQSVREGPKVQDIASAQAALASAQANLQGTKDRLSTTKNTAETGLQSATAGLTSAQARYAQAKYNWEFVNETGQDPVTPNVKDSKGKAVPNKASDGAKENYYAAFVQAEAALNQAEQSVKTAQLNYDAARQGEVTGIAAAEQAVVQAQQAVDKLQLPPDKAQLASANAALASAQAARGKLVPNPRDSAKAQAAAAVASANAAVELAKINRERAELRAPFDGVIASVNIDPGDPHNTNPTSAVRVVDMSKLRAEVQISDTDIAKIVMGQDATMTADALPGQKFQGKVSFISPTAAVNGTLRSYKVKIDLTDVTGLRAGMSVRVEFPKA